MRTEIVMRQERMGFYLYAFCIYLSCVMVLATIIIPFSFYAFQAMVNFVKKDKELRDVYLLLSIIKRELQKAPAKQTDLKQLSINEIVWKASENNDVGLLYSEKNASFFIVHGSYDKEKKVWKTKRQSLIMKNIFVSFMPIGQENTIVKCKVMVNDLVFSSVIISQNRIYAKNQ